MREVLKFSQQPQLKSSSVIIGWTMNTSRLGIRVVDYLNKKLSGQNFGEIEPSDFFPLEGIAIQEDLIQFPESRFYVCPDSGLILFKSLPPSYNWYQFLNLILDVAERCHAKELYAIGEMITPSAHTSPRQTTSTFNSMEFRNALSSYNLGGGGDYETPPGQKPTINSFLLWAAKRRNIPAVTLWMPIPFYLLTSGDPKAQKVELEFFNQRFNLGIDLSDIDEEIRQQSQKMAEVRNKFPDVDESIKKLEANLGLSDEEGERLIQEVERSLRQKKD